MEKIHFEVAGMSDVGIVKNVNEDSIFYKVADIGNKIAGIFAVADGVGNLQHGELASSMTVSELINWWQDTFLKHYTDYEYLKRTLQESILSANDKLVELEYSQNLKTASTVSVLFIYGDNCQIYNVGDSRIYRYSKMAWIKTLEQITQDDSCDIDKEYNGKIIKKSVLTEYIGKKNGLNIFSREEKLRKGQIYLICSDGIYKTMDSNKLKEIIIRYSSDINNGCKKLIEKVKENRETDNISAILVKVKGNR